MLPDVDDHLADTAVRRQYTAGEHGFDQPLPSPDRHDGRHETTVR